MKFNLRTEARDEIVHSICAKRRKIDQIEGEQMDYAFEIKKLKFELNELIGINRFPLELIALIMGRLSVADALCCEAVCQKWSYFVKQLRIESLVIAKTRERRPRRWSYSNELIQPETPIVRANLDFENLENSFLFTIKRLKILNRSDEFGTDSIHKLPLFANLDFVNKLASLEVLEISKIHLENEAAITLPNLRYLAINRVRSKLKLVTPNLTDYKGNALKNVQFVFPEYLKRLHLHHYCLEAKQFANLDYLCVKKLRAPADQVLTNHPALKVLSIRPNFKHADCMEADDESDFNLLRSAALEILAQKSHLKRNCKLIFFGIELDDAGQLDDYEFRKDLVRLHIRNYAKLRLEELRWIRGVNYNALQSCIEDGLVDEVPADFHEKFGQVNEILLDEKIDDEERLFDFLRKFKNFDTFSLELSYDSGFEGPELSFFEKLFTEFPSIWHLRIRDPDGQGGMASDLDFLFKSSKMYKLYTEFGDDNDIADKIFEHFETFEFSFEINGTIATVKRTQKDGRFEIWADNRFFRDFPDLGEAFEQLDQHYGD